MKIGNIEVYGIIYKITNKVNGKCYIGQTTQSFNKRYHSGGGGLCKIERVYNEHKYRMEHNKSYNKHLLISVEKYGFNAFDVIDIYDIAFSKEELNIKECMYIQIFDCLNNGYNATLGGEGGKGYKHSDDFKEWKSISMQGKNNPMYGKTHSEEIKKKISENKKGKFVGENSPLYGKSFSEEHRKKISESAKGKNNPMYGKSGIDSPIAKSVICLTTKKIFHTVTEGSKYYNISRQAIGKCCRGKGKSAGKFNGKKLVWKYLVWNHNKTYRVKEGIQ